VAECAAWNVGTIAVGDLSGIHGDASWGDHGNLDLHGWAFDHFTELLAYKAAERGISVERVDEHDTSKSCAGCVTIDGSQRVNRGLYACDECGLVTNADVNGAENIRQKVLPNLVSDRGDGDNGRMAQPAVRLFDKSTASSPTRAGVPRTIISQRLGNRAVHGTEDVIQVVRGKACPQDIYRFQIYVVYG
jgi:putative transposase